MPLLKLAMVAAVTSITCVGYLLGKSDFDHLVKC